MTDEMHDAGPFPDQKPGTSGLRKSTAEFRQPGYLECFLQAIFDADPPAAGAILIVGGDGRYFAREAAETVVGMAVANGYSRVVAGRDGLLSTPAVSALIRARGAHGGIILSASHNPGGADGDFGVKYNGRDGGPATPALTNAIYARSLVMEGWRQDINLDLDLGALGERSVGEAVLEIVDPVEDWLALMQTQFDFPAIRALVSSPGFRMRFDAMNAVTGPYAHALFEDCLGAPRGTVLRGQPMPDFGGVHPDPHPDWLTDLMELTRGPHAVDFAAASDGDGDRNMILGPDLIVSPGDSLAILAANAHLVPAFRERGLAGVARSLPTSRALDRVAVRKGLNIFETPTGWKYFTNLLESGKIALCGEESFGTGSDHVREKDGLWAVLFWLNLLAVTGSSVRELVEAHWADYGRDLFQREDYEDLPTSGAEGFMDDLRTRASGLVGMSAHGFKVRAARSFDYVDPVDGSEALEQGHSLMLDPDARITFRLSGTGTGGATLRVYLERFSQSLPDAGLDVRAELLPLSEASRALTGLTETLGRATPSCVT